MTHPFPSEEWVSAYGEAVNASASYRDAGAKWTHGPVCLVVKAEEAINLPADTGVWLDLHQGVCRAARVVGAETAQQAPFVITAEYARWKQVIRKELDPIKGMMQGKLKLRGSLPIIVRFVRAANELVNCATRVPTRFLDE